MAQRAQAGCKPHPAIVLPYWPTSQGTGSIRCILAGTSTATNAFCETCCNSLCWNCSSLSPPIQNLPFRGTWLQFVIESRDPSRRCCLGLVCCVGWKLGQPGRHMRRLLPEYHNLITLEIQSSHPWHPGQCHINSIQLPLSWRVLRSAAVWTVVWVRVRTSTLSNHTVERDTLQTRRVWPQLCNSSQQTAPTWGTEEFRSRSLSTAPHGGVNESQQPENHSRLLSLFCS